MQDYFQDRVTKITILRQSFQMKKAKGKSQFDTNQDSNNPETNTLKTEDSDKLIINNKKKQTDKKNKLKAKEGLPFKEPKSKLPERRVSNLENYKKLKVQRNKEYTMQKKLHEQFIKNKKGNTQKLEKFSKMEENNTYMVEENLDEQKKKIRDRLRSRRDKSISKIKSKSIIMKNGKSDSYADSKITQSNIEIKNSVNNIVNLSEIIQNKNNESQLIVQSSLIDQENMLDNLQISQDQITPQLNSENTSKDSTIIKEQEKEDEKKIDNEQNNQSIQNHINEENNEDDIEQKKAKEQNEEHKNNEDDIEKEEDEKNLNIDEEGPLLSEDINRNTQTILSHKDSIDVKVFSEEKLKEEKINFNEGSSDSPNEDIFLTKEPEINAKQMESVKIKDISDEMIQIIKNEEIQTDQFKKKIKKKLPKKKVTSKKNISKIKSNRNNDIRKISHKKTKTESEVGVSIKNYSKPPPISYLDKLNKNRVKNNSMNANKIKISSIAKQSKNTSVEKKSKLVKSSVGLSENHKTKSSVKKISSKNKNSKKQIKTKKSGNPLSKFLKSPKNIISKFESKK